MPREIDLEYEGGARETLEIPTEEELRRHEKNLAGLFENLFGRPAPGYEKEEK